MAKVEGLTIIINGDATPFKRAMREARAEGTTLSRHLSAVNKLIQFDPSSTVLLTRRQQLLGSALAQNATHLAQLQQANATYAARAASLTAAERRQWQAVQRRMSEVELEYVQLRQKAIQYGAAASAANTRVISGARGMQSALGRVSNAMMAVSAVTALIGAASIYAAAQFEQSFAGVRKTIIATQSEYDELARSTREIALEKPISVNDVNEIMMYAGQLGVASNNLTKFASTMADLDVATDMDLEEGSMQLARFMNIIGTNQADVDRLGATIVDLGNNSATTESQIMQMAMRIAGSGANIGLSAQNVLALATSLSSVGIQAEMGGNAISTIMNRIDKAVALDQESLATWAATAGMTTEEFKYNWENNVQDTLISVIKGMGTFRDEGGNLNVLLKEMGISYMRQVDTMQRLSRAGDLTEEMFVRSNTAWAANTALVREATQRYDTAESKLQMMKNAIYDAGITIGQAILPAFKDVVLGVTGLVQAFGSMDDGTRGMIVNIGAVVTAAGLLTKALELGAGGVGRVAEGYASLKTHLLLASAGATRYSEQSIALASSLGAEAVAAQANAIATRDAAAAKAASARAYANHLRSIGMSEAATKLETFATGQDAIAQAADAEATALNGAAKLQAGKKAGIFAAAQQFLTAQTWGLAAALGVTNGMLLAFAAAAAAGVIIAVKIAEAVSPMNQLTEASKKQAEEVDAAKAKYDELSRTQGEHADATVKAKAAYEELNREFNDTKETVGEMRERMWDLAKGLGEVADESEKAQDEADTTAGKILLAADGVNQFRTATDEVGQSKLLGYLSVLREEVEGFDATMEDARSGNEKFAIAMRRVEDIARKVRFDAAQEAFGNYAVGLDEANKAIEEFIAQNELLQGADLSLWLAEYDSGAMKPGDYRFETMGYYSELAKKRDEMQQGMEDSMRTMQENAEKTMVYETALRYAQDANVDLATACEYVSGKMGLAAEYSEVVAYSEQKAADAAFDATEQMNQMMTGLDELVAKTPALASMLNDAGSTTSGLAQYLSDAGISLEDFAKAVEDNTQRATDALDKMDSHADTTIWDLISNLQYNAEQVGMYGDNMQTLWDRYRDDTTEGTQETLALLQSWGPEYAAQIGQLIDDPAAFDELRNAVVQGMMAGPNATLQEMGAYGDALAAAQAGAMEKAYGAMDAAAKDGNAKAAKTASDGADGVKRSFSMGLKVTGLEVGKLYNEIGDASLQMKKHNGETYGWGQEAAQGFANGVSSKIEATRAAVSEMAETVKRLIHFSLPDEGPLREGGGPRAWMRDMVDEMIIGMRSRESALSTQAGRLASAMRSPIDDAMGDFGYARFAASYPYAAYGQGGMGMQSTVVNHNETYIGDVSLTEGTDAAQAASALASAVRTQRRGKHGLKN